MIKIGFLLSYDYEYIFTALPLVYDEADKIVISYDSEGKTWAGNKIEIPEDIFAKIKNLDKDGKIEFYADKFYLPATAPLDLDTRQRNMMAAKMGKGGWHIQIDSDEYAYDFKKLANFLRQNKFLLKNPEKNKINFLVNWIVLFKQNEKGFFYITPHDEKCNFVTNYPDYVMARKPKDGRNLFLNFFVIHQSWARSEVEILQKIENWGHTKDFEVMEFFEKWKNLNEENYRELINFHPLSSDYWKGIEFKKADNNQEIINYFSQKLPQPALTLDISFTRKLKMFIKSL